MDAASAFFWAHPIWVWLALAAAFLAIEAATGSGWLLWPAGSAAFVGLASLVFPTTFAVQAALFAALTIVTTFLGRRYLRGPGHGASDINDAHGRLIGKRGEVSSLFKAGQGRVFVDGKEWSAELDGADLLGPGDKIEVVAVLGGARLRVKPG
ncbi:MAG TPA: NfeD family protein [Caulobacteraceae bacterium]